MKPLKALLIICSLAGCAGKELPDTNLGVINSPGKKWEYNNLKTDYYLDGNNLKIKPGTPLRVMPIESVDSLNKFHCVDIDSWANLKAWEKSLKADCTCQ